MKNLGKSGMISQVHTRRCKLLQQQSYGKICSSRYQQSVFGQWSFRKKCRRIWRVGWFPSSWPAFGGRHRICEPECDQHFASNWFLVDIHPIIPSFLRRNFDAIPSMPMSMCLCARSLSCFMEDITTYLVPYLPVTPTFLVLFVILADVAVMNGGWRWGTFNDVDFLRYFLCCSWWCAS